MPNQSIISWQTNQGKPVHTLGYTVTPQAQALKLHTPVVSLVWNRPVAILVRQDNAEYSGAEERIPIVDATRLAQIAVIPIAALLALLLARLAPARRVKG